MGAITISDANPSVLGVDIVHWWDGTDTSRQTLVGGKLSEWTDKIGGIAATQSTDALRPAAPTLDGEVRFTGTNINLALPILSRSYIEHTWFLMLARLKWSVFGPASGSLFTINGSSTSTGMRQPWCGYTKAGSIVDAQWWNGNSNKVSAAAATDDAWHSIVGRREVGACYLSVDGGAEVSLAGTLALPIPGAGATAGLIGDFRTTGSIDWGLDTLIIGQRDRTPTEIAHLHRWAKNRRGIA